MSGDTAYVPTPKGHAAVLTQRILDLLAETCDECPHHEPAVDEATAARIAALLFTAHIAAVGDPSVTEARRELTDAERRVLDAIRAQIKQRGYAPTVRELGAATGLSSSSSVVDTLRRLADKGAIRRDPNTPRAITILEAGDG